MQQIQRFIQAIPLPIISGGIAFFVYLLTMAPDLTWANFGGDGGDLITAAVSLGVPHPSGYPTYVLLGKLFSWLPFGSVAYRFNLFSAVGMAVTVGFITAVTQAPPNTKKSLPSKWVPIAGALTFAFSVLVWSQATITEVYGLNLAVVAALLWSLWGKRPSFIIGILLGLSITTHLTSIFLIPLVFFIVTPKQGKNRLLLIAGMSIGLIPYALIPLLARSNSPVNWANVVDFSSWWWLVSGQTYRGYLFSLSQDLLRTRATSWGWELLNQFTLLGLPLIWIGVRQQNRDRPKLMGGMVGTAVFYLVYAFGYSTDDAIILLLPALLLLSIPLTMGLRTVGRIAILLPVILLFLNFSPSNLRNDGGLRRETAVLFDALPSEAIIATPGDTTIFAFWYFQHVENQRLDLIIVDQNLFAYDWYRQQLQTVYPDLVQLEKDDFDTFQQYNAALRPFCKVTLASRLNEDRLQNLCR
ncbi:MAG: DUF2723 domain-containing protein [Chloroflexi bacterium]|nr:DUF2723 domain-containing protein [Chloroflexota bacterium]